MLIGIYYAVYPMNLSKSMIFLVSNMFLSRHFTGIMNYYYICCINVRSHRISTRVPYYFHFFFEFFGMNKLKVKKKKKFVCLDIVICKLKLNLIKHLITFICCPLTSQNCFGFYRKSKL